MFYSGQLIVSQASKVLVGLLFTPADVADFAIPFVLVLMVGNFVFALTMATKPMATLLRAERKDEKIRRLFFLSTKYGVLVAAPAAASFLLFGDEILLAWVGRSRHGPAGLLLAILAIPQMLRVSQLAGYSVVTGLGKHRYFGLSVLIQAVSGLVLAFVLARPLGLGLVGVALGISIPELIGSGFFVPRYCCRVVGVRVWDMIRRGVLPAMTASIPVILFLVAARLFIPVDSRTSVIAMFGAAVAIWGVAAWALAFGREEKGWLLDLLSRNGSHGGS
jgi:O-antigen/teichoic acid export membrane protein